MRDGKFQYVAVLGELLFQISQSHNYSTSHGDDKSVNTEKQLWYQVSNCFLLLLQLVCSPSIFMSTRRTLLVLGTCPHSAALLKKEAYEYDNAKCDLHSPY